MKNKIIKYSVITFLYLLLWEALAMCFSTWLFPGPVDTLKSLISMLGSRDFYYALTGSFFRIMLGFFIALVLSVFLCILGLKIDFIRSFLKPLMLLAKSVPVACLTILVIIWFGSSKLSFVVVLLVSVPILYSQLLTISLGTDVKLPQMAKVYKMTTINKIKCIYLKQIYMPFRSAIKVSIAMSFKAGIAAELIGYVKNSIGERLYLTKLYFETGELFAWIIVIMLVAYLTELMVDYLYVTLMKIFMKCPIKIKNKRCNAKKTIDINDASISFEDRNIINKLSIKIDSPGIYGIAGESGYGKTTFLNMISGIIPLNQGSITAGECSYSFQDLRLLDGYNARENLVFCGCNDKEGLLEIFLDEEVLKKDVSLLSGGERRRVENARALSSDTDIVLLDEPFAGLDLVNKEICFEQIKKQAKNKIIIITMHDINESKNDGIIMLNI